jgi:sugar phosphate isomerase/epimerase
MPAERAVEIAAEAGFPGVDLLVRDLVEAGTDPRLLRRRMNDLDVRGGGWPLPVQWRGEESRFIEDIAALPRFAEAAAILGLSRTGTWVMPQVDPACLGAETSPGEARWATTRLHLDRLGKIARVLDRFGAKLGLEIMGPATARRGEGFVRTYSELGSSLDELRRSNPNVGVLIDVFHLFAAGEEFSAGWVWGEKASVWVHLADAAHADLARLRDQDRALPGETGLSDSRPLLRELLRLGYDGPVTAEPLGLSQKLRNIPALEVARRTRQALQSIWPEGPLP